MLRGVQHYLIQFVSDLRLASTNKTNRHDISEILLKVALNTIKQTNNNSPNIQCFSTAIVYYIYIYY